MNEELLKALKEYIHAYVAERIEDAFNRDGSHEAIRLYDATEKLDLVAKETKS